MYTICKRLFLLSKLNKKVCRAAQVRVLKSNKIFKISIKFRHGWTPLSYSIQINYLLFEKLDYLNYLYFLKLTLHIMWNFCFTQFCVENLHNICGSFFTQLCVWFLHYIFALKFYTFFLLYVFFKFINLFCKLKYLDI